jgi:hypothetical protein
MVFILLRRNNVLRVFCYCCTIEWHYLPSCDTVWRNKRCVINSLRDLNVGGRFFRKEARFSVGRNNKKPRIKCVACSSMEWGVSTSTAWRVRYGDFLLLPYQMQLHQTLSEGVAERRYDFARVYVALSPRTGVPKLFQLAAHLQV